MPPQQNGKSHFLVGQEMNGSIVVSCVETKSPSGSRWIKIHREFKLKNGSQFWVDKLISREKGEETLADWLKEQAEIQAKKEAAQAKAREMARLRMQANKNGAQSSTNATTTGAAASTAAAAAASGATAAASGQNGGNTAADKSKFKAEKMSPRSSRRASIKNSLVQEERVEVEKRPTKKPPSLRNNNKEETDVEKEGKAPSSTRGKLGADSSTSKKPPSLRNNNKEETDVEKEGKAPSSLRGKMGVDSTPSKKPPSLRNSNKEETDVEKEGKAPSSLRGKMGVDSTTSKQAKRTKSPRKQKPSSGRLATSDDDVAGIEKNPKKPSSLRMRTDSDNEDETEAPKSPKKPASLGAVKEKNDSPKKKGKKHAKVPISPEKRRQEGEGTLKQKAVEKSKPETEEKAKHEAAKEAMRGGGEKAKRETEEVAKREAEALAKHTAEEKAKREAEEQAKRKEEKAKLEAEAAEKERRETEERTRLAAEEKAKLEAEEKAKREAAEIARREAEERARILAEEEARREAEEKARLAAEAAARREAEEKMRLEKEALATREAEEKARREVEEKARREAEEQRRKEAEVEQRRKEEELSRLEATKEAERRADEQRQATTSAAEEARVKNFDSQALLAQLPGGEIESAPVKKNSSLAPYDEKLADSFGSAMIAPEPDVDMQNEKTDNNVVGVGITGGDSTLDSTLNIPNERNAAKNESKTTKSDDRKLKSGTDDEISQVPDNITPLKSDGNKSATKATKREDSKTAVPDSNRESKSDEVKAAKSDDPKSAKSDDPAKKKKKTKTKAGDPVASGGEGDLDDISRVAKVKKKKKKDTKKGKSSKNPTEDSAGDPTSQADGDDSDNKTAKKKTKKKHKGKDKKAASPKHKKKEKVQDAVVSSIHSQLEAMFDGTSEDKNKAVADPPSASDSNATRGVQSRMAADDNSLGGSAEFHINPELLGHPLDDYSSDEPSSDSDDDFAFRRVAGINDFDNTNIGTSQRPSMAQKPTELPKPPNLEATDSENTENSGGPEGDVVDYSTLDEIKDSYPTFSKIMGVWIDRENKLLYKTPVELSSRKSEAKKEVDIPTAPEAPTFGSMVRKWEAKLLHDEPEKSELAPRKLRNVWAEKLEFTKPFTKPSHHKSADEIKLIEDTVEKNFAFKDLTKDEMAPLVDAFERVEYQPGAIIGEEGEPETFYSIVQSGEVDFHSDGRKVGKAVPGDAFGELSLLYNVARAAEAKASGEGEHQTVLFQIEQTNFRYILREQMLRSQEEKLKLLQSVDVFKNLDDSDLRQLGSAMVPHRFKEGDNLSDAFRDAPFCLVQRGSVTATDIQVGAGQSFGEKSLISNESTVYEVRAMSDGLAFTIDRESFEKVFGDFDRVSMKYRDKQTLASIRQIRAAKLEDEQLDTLVRQISEVEFKAGKEIFEFNAKMPPALYMVRSGRVKIVKKNGEEKIIEPGGYFGQEYMLFTSKQSKDIVPDFVVVKYSAVALEKTVCGVLTLQEVGIVSGRIQALQDIESTKNIALDDLERHRILGEGQFGIVWLVTVKNLETDPYALKIQYLDDPCRDDSADCIKEEIRMMRAIQHQFVIQLINTYEDEDTISMLLTLAPGGELFDILHRQDVNGWWVSGLAEPIAKFYSTIVADTLAFMHRQKFVYRDLKPENILIDKDGYPVLTDFGFVKKLEEDKTYTFCGTPNYVAPEVVTSIGHNASADNWSLGVLIYELIDGANPFWEDGMDQQTLYELIADALYPPIARKKCSKHGHDLITRLLEKDPNKRLGTFREKDILEHKWFRDFDVKELRAKQIKAPWVPDAISLEATDESRDD